MNNRIVSVFMAVVLILSSSNTSRAAYDEITSDSLCNDDSSALSTVEEYAGSGDSYELDLGCEDECIIEETELMSNSIATLFWPVRDSAGNCKTKITSHYGTHTGIDIGGAYGCDWYAAYSGTVYRKYEGCISNGYDTGGHTRCNPTHNRKHNSITLNGTTYSGEYCNDSFGNGVIIQSTINGQEYYFLYAHMNNVSSDFKQGDYVKAGTYLGTVGDRGFSFGTHAHFEVDKGKWYGASVNNDPESSGCQFEYDYSLSKSPIGHIDSIGYSDGKIYVGGWAYDPDSPQTSIQINLYIDGYTDPIASFKTHIYREIAGGVNCGFDEVIDVSGLGLSNKRKVSLWGIDVTGDDNASIGSEELDFSRGIGLSSPIGHIDSAGYSDGKIYVGGWAYDPDSPQTSIQINLYIDGYASTIASFKTHIYREIAGGVNCGFDEAIDVSSLSISGKKRISLVGIDVTGNDNIEIGSAEIELPSNSVHVSDVLLDKSILSIKTGQTEILNATITPSNASNPAVTWSSSNTEVATVSASGRVKAFAPGECTVTVTTKDGGKKASCKISVIGHTIKYISDGAIYATQIVADGQVLIAPEPIVKEGFTFEGWYIDEVFSKLYDFEYPAKKDMSLYAKWKENEIAPEPVPDRGEIEDGDIEEGAAIPQGVWIAGLQDLTYDGTNQKQNIRIYDNKTRLTEKTDYILSYKNNKNAFGQIPANGVEAQKAPQVIIKMRGNYSGKQTIYFKIKPLTIEDSTVFNVTLCSSGKKIVPVLSYNGKKLKERTDYTYVNSGGLYIIEGKGNYTGTIRFTKADLDNSKQVRMSKVSVGHIPALIYKGSAYTEAEIAEYLKNVVSYNKVPLVINEDYYVSHVCNSRDAGTATVILKGLKNDGRSNSYWGEKRIKIKIQPYPISGEGVLVTSADGSSNISAFYAKGGAKPDVVIRYYGKTLKNGRDYTMSFNNNKSIQKASDGKKDPTITIIGKGNFRGKATIVFSIEQAKFSDTCGIRAIAEDKFLSSTSGNYTTKISVYDKNGNVLKVGTDYSSAIVYKRGNVVLTNDSQVAIGDKITVEVKGAGTNYSDDTVTTTYRVLSGDVDISKATIKIKDQEYSGTPISITEASQIQTAYIGKDKTPLIISVDNGVSGDFVVVEGSYVKNIAKGIAQVTIKGINGYGGHKTIAFKIRSKILEDL